MSNLLQLFKGPNSSTVATLSALLARAERGEIDGLAVCYRSQGFEESAFTGSYAASPAEGVNAAMRLSWKLTQAQDVIDEKHQRAG